MKTRPSSNLIRLFAIVILLAALAPPGRASDHADPMSLNVLKAQESPEANITDLHAFVVDRAGKLITDGDPSITGDQLIISLCVRRALRPDQAGGLQLKGYKFRVHLDLNPPVRIFEEAKTREEYEKQLGARNEQIATASKAFEEAKEKAKTDPSAYDKNRLTTLEQEMKAAVTRRSTLIAARETDRSMQELYGGVITHPDAIADTGLLEFELDLVGDGEQSQAILHSHRFEGIGGERNIVSHKKLVGATERIAEHPFKPGAINIEAGVFDDPFIFPRFFRRNVVGIVTSIPLANLVRPSNGPLLIWATTHDRKGKEIDHVGRSLRTQLPRFGNINEMHPAEHVRAITQVHERPSLLQHMLATFVSPLFAHRHYDSVPDVMVYDLRKPAHFPNGRALTDDVAQTLANAGETLLVELSYAESKQFPRATQNDKPFSPTFPYLAPRWTSAEVAAHSGAGSTMGNYAVPRAAESAAIAPPNFKDFSWQTLWLFEVVAIALLTVLLLVTVRSKRVRVVLVVVAIIAIWLLQSVHAANLPGTDPRAIAQPGKKLCRLIFGTGWIGALTLAWFFALGRRTWRKWPLPLSGYPEGRETLIADDLRAPSSYDEIHNALFDPTANRQYYKVWGGAGEPALPLYQQTFASIARGLLRIWKDFAILQAARRTLRSHADLRWGPDGKGFRRLVHPMGICLAGEWKIESAPPGKNYSGYFAPGKMGRVIARYSLGGNDPRNSRCRSLALVGKIFPPTDTPDHLVPPAHFFAQQDIAGEYTDSVTEAILTNSPPVTVVRRISGIFTFLVIVIGLARADKQPAERQLTKSPSLRNRRGPKLRARVSCV